MLAARLGSILVSSRRPFASARRSMIVFLISLLAVGAFHAEAQTFISGSSLSLVNGSGVELTTDPLLQNLCPVPPVRGPLITLGSTSVDLRLTTPGSLVGFNGGQHCVLSGPLILMRGH